MLFILTNAHPDRLAEVGLMAGDEDKSLILAGDAVFHARQPLSPALAALAAEDIFVAADAVAELGLEVDSAVEVVDYERMAELVMDEFDRVISL